MHNYQHVGLYMIANIRIISSSSSTKNIQFPNNYLSRNVWISMQLCLRVPMPEKDGWNKISESWMKLFKGLGQKESKSQHLSGLRKNNLRLIYGDSKPQKGG